MTVTLKELKGDLERRMQGAIESLNQEFSGLRTGRASTALLDPVKVSVWGQEMPINQVATISVPEARMISVQVWDKSNVSVVEKAIRDSNLGLNPAADGELIRIPLPPLNEERRIELVKIAKSYAEEGRIAIRNVRRHGMDEVKKLQKDSHISEDESREWQDEIQNLTDKSIKEVDENLAKKEKDIMQV